jgi:uncharacterized protein (TIGR00645 family)
MAGQKIEEIYNKLARLEFHLERFIFWTRWIVSPAYLVLALCLLILLYKLGEEFYQLLAGLTLFNETQAIAQVLTIVDVILIMNLVVMILFVGYNTFVSKIHVKQDKTEDRPSWLESLDYSGLKLQLLGSVIAVSAIKILREFVEISSDEKVDQQKFIWLCVFHVLFLTSALVVAIVNKLKPLHAQDQEQAQLGSEHPGRNVPSPTLPPLSP